MNINLNEKEIEFIVSCVHMASRESFYAAYNDSFLGYGGFNSRDDLGIVAIPLLKKIGCDNEQTEKIMDGY